MAIPNFQQQSMQAMQGGLQIGSALRNAQDLQSQREFQSQLRPMQLESQQLGIDRQQQQIEQTQQQDLENNLIQDAVLLASYDEETGKQLIPGLVDKYAGNEAVIAGLNSLYKSTGREFEINKQLMMSALTGKSIGGKKRALSEPEKNLETMNRLESELAEAEQSGDVDLATGKKNQLDNFMRLTNKFGATAQEKSDIKVGEAGQTVTEKGKAKRIQGYIDSGIEAADSYSNVKRSIDLLSEVKTGGFDAVALRAKQMFGIESADEAELAAGMGKAILAQLKPLFGSAFTKSEGERLERIEANFGKSTEGNKRLLNNVLKITDRAARRGLKAAEKAGDTFTADEIKNSMSFDIKDKIKTVNWVDM